MGTGVNVQQRLKALHHLDVPWLPSQIEQREGRIERQGNQHDEIDIYAYATLGSMDATMWQNNERKARFIEAALSGDRTIRRLEDAGSQANQFAMAKAIASGDSRLMRKAGLESEIARLQRQRAAHIDDQHAIRRQIRDARHDQAHAEARIRAITSRPGRRQSTRGELFTMEIEGQGDHATQGGGRFAADQDPSCRAGTYRAQLDGRPHRRLRPDLRIQPSLRDERLEPDLVLERTDFSQSIDIDGETTAVGIIARLEHVLDRMDAELEEQRRRVIDAKARLAGYRAAPGRDVPLAGRTGRQARPACRDRGRPRQHRGHRQRRPFDPSISLNTVVARLLVHWQLCALVGRSAGVVHFSKADINIGTPFIGRRRSLGRCEPHHRHRNNHRSIRPAIPSRRMTKAIISSTSASVSAALKLDCAKFSR